MNVSPACVLRRSARLCRLLCLGLLVLAGLCLALGVSVRPAHALSNGGTLSISNSTVAYNSVTGGNGGEVGGGLSSNGTTLSISNSTFAHNSANSGGGLLIYGESGTVSISNSTIAYNSATYGGGH